MRNNKKVKNPTEFFIGMRVKLPMGGWFYGSNKQKEWFKGIVKKLGPIREDGKIHSIVTKCYSKKYKTIGNVMSIEEQCDEIYKTK